MRLTIFTPTFNRAELLHRLFDSLSTQSCLDFEWLVVDDGSVDDTDRVVSMMKSKALFEVQYVHTENRGKHAAYNEALKYARGDWFLCLDSDDVLAPDAVEQIVKVMSKGDPVDGIVAYKSDQYGKLIGDVLPKDVATLHIPELDTVYGCSGDYVFAYRMDIAKEFPFTVFEGEKFVPESVMLDVLGQHCVVAVLPIVLMICEYQFDGYSKNANNVMKRNPKGYSMYFMQRVDIFPCMKQKMVAAGKYWCFRWMGGKPPVRYTGKHRVLTGLCLPLGLIFRVYYKFVRGF